MKAMTATDVLRELWRRKLWVLPVIAVAAAAGVLVASRGFTVERASTDILVDTPRSQAVDIGTRGQQSEAIPQIDTLATRARLLGNLMASGSIERAIASRAGVSSDRLIVVPPPDTEAADSADGLPEAEGASKADATVLTVTTDSSLPILHVVAQAPNAATAQRLAHGAVAVLKAYLGSVAANDEVPEAQRLGVHEIGARQAVSSPGGPGMSAAFALAFSILALGCAVIVVLSRAVAGRGRHGDPVAEVNGNGHVTPADHDASRNGSGHPARAPSAGFGE
jgi:hypothetical protein